MIGSDYMNFDACVRKSESLLNTKDELMGLYIMTAIFTGLRIGDVLKLDWSFFDNETFELQEGKTNKKRTLTLNSTLKKYANKVRKNRSGKVFVSQKGSVYATQSINTKLKGIFSKESKDKNISSHSLRKTFARKVYDENGQSEHILIVLSKVLNHSSSEITRIYLGISDTEIANIYLGL
jgi:integrase